jgi:iron complex outermembrane receptor protein
MMLFKSILLIASVMLTVAQPQAYAATDAKPTACSPNYIYAQELVDETIARHPELTALVMHVTPPGTKDNIVVASNIWLTGQKSDEDDVAVIASGKTMTEMNQAANKFEVQGVLQNVLGATVGSVATVFPYKAGESKVSLEAKAAAIRSELSKRILNAANLMEPFPYDPQIARHTYAEKIMEQELAKFPYVLVFAMHVTPPNRSSNVIIASNLGRLGKADDVKDIDVLKTGKPNAELRGADKRAQIVIPLKDATGKSIGILNLLLHNADGADEARMIARGEAVRDDVASKTPTLTALFEPAH